MKKIRPFGPAIGKWTLPPEILSDFLRGTNDVLKKKRSSMAKNLAGRIEDEWEIFPEDVGENTVNYLMDCCKEYLLRKYGVKNNKKQGEELRPDRDFINHVHMLSKTGSFPPIPNPEIKNMWVNEMKEGEYNPVHNHSGEVSSILYLKVPSFEKGVANKKHSHFGEGSTDGWTHFIHGSLYRFCEGLYRVHPKAGDLYLFPSTLLHTAYPFKGNAKRRSVSFNVNYVGQGGPFDSLGEAPRGIDAEYAMRPWGRVT